MTSEATTGAAFPGVVNRPIEGERLPFSAVWSLRNDNPALRRLSSMARTLSKLAAAGGSPMEKAALLESCSELSASKGYDGGQQDTVA